MSGSAQAGRLVRALGPTEVEIDGEEVALTPAERRVITLLAVRPGRSVHTDRLIDALWPDDPPANARQSLHNHVGRLRKKVGADCIISHDDGYRLDANMVIVDTAQFMADATSGALDSSGVPAALALWRGIAFESVDGDDLIDSERTRLNQIRTGAEDRWMEQLLDSGDYVRAVAELDRMIDEEPLRENRWFLLATGLLRSGRRGDALAMIERARRTLARDLGIDVGPELADLERRLLMGPAEFVTKTQHDIVGRDSLIAATVRAIESTALGPLLVGEAGIGKTAVGVAVENQLRRDGYAVVHVSCSEYPSVPLQPFASALDELIDRCGLEVLLEWAGDNAAVLEWLVDGARGAPPTRRNEVNVLASRDWLLDIIADAFRAANDSIGPLAIWFDDLHDCPPTSLRLVTRLAVEGRVRIGGATRRRDLGIDIDATFETLPVEPLTRSDVGRLLTSEQARGDTSDLTESIYANTGGHPLLTTELLDHLRRYDHLRLVDGRWVEPEYVELPERIHSLVQAQVSQLSRNDQHLIEVAAILGTVVDTEALRMFSTPSEITGVLALPNSLLVGDDKTVRFRHALLAHAVYDSIPSGRRIELHDSVANALDVLGRHSSTTAHHRVAAAPIDPDGAVEAASIAGDEARESLQFSEAQRWYGTGLALMTQNGDADKAAVVQLRIRFGDTLRLAGDPENLEVLVEAAAQAVALGEHTLLSEAAFALLQLGSASESGHLNERAIQLGDLALEQEPDPAVRAKLGAAMSVTLAMSSEARRCRDLYDTAEQTALTNGDDEVISAVMPFTYMALGLPEDIDHRQTNGQWLVDYGSSNDDPIAEFEGRHLLFSVALSRGAGDELRQHHHRMTLLLPRVGDVGRQWSVAYQSAAIAHLEGDLELAEQHADRALGIAAPLMASRALAAYSAQLLAIRHGQGRLSELLPSLDEMIEDQPLMPAWRAAAALAAVDVDNERVKAEFDVIAPDSFASLPRDFMWIPTVLTAGRAVAAVGDAHRSAQAATMLEPYSGLFCWQGTCSYGAVDTALAELAFACGNTDDVARYASAARKASERLNARQFISEADAIAARLG